MPKQPAITTVLGTAVKILHKLRIVNKKWIAPSVLIQILLKAKLIPEAITEQQCNRALARCFPGFEDKKYNTHIVARRQIKPEKINYYGYYLKDNGEDSVNDNDWFLNCYMDIERLLLDSIPVTTRSSSSSCSSSSSQITQQLFRKESTTQTQVRTSSNKKRKATFIDHPQHVPLSSLNANQVDSCTIDLNRLNKLENEQNNSCRWHFLFFMCSNDRGSPFWKGGCVLWFVFLTIYPS